MRRRALLATGIGCGLLFATFVARPTPLLVWNASASAPVGLWRNRPQPRFARGDMVVADPPVSVRGLAAARGYVPASVPLVKRILGVPGDSICALGQEVFLDGAQVGERLLADAQGRALPHWSGCIRLARDQYFLMTREVRGSFDGRYFGPTASTDILGKATLLWTD